MLFINKLIEKYKDPSSLMVILLVMFLTASISLFFSYNFISYPLWINEFSDIDKVKGILFFNFFKNYDKTFSNFFELGAFIELLRISTYFAFMFIWLNFPFKDHFNLFIKSDFKKGKYQTYFRILFFIGLITLLIYHFIIAPINLTGESSWLNLDKELIFSYLAYLPYSLICYLFIGLPMLIFTFSFYEKQYKLILSNSDKLTETLLTTNNQTSLIQSFQNFRITIDDVLNNLIWVISTITIVAFLEQRIFQYALSNPAKYITFGIYGLFFIALIVVFIIMSAYDKKFRNARKALNKLGININDFEKNNRAKHVLKNAVENNLTIIVPTLPFLIGSMFNFN